MKYRIITDLHLGAPHQLKKWDTKRLIDEHTENTILTGDIFDFANMKRKKVKTYRAQESRIEHLYHDNYLKGNHECEVPKTYFIIKNNVLFCHGHTIFWDMDEVYKWEQRKAGKHTFGKFLITGRFGYGLYKNTVEFFVNHENSYDPSEEIMIKCHELCTNNNCDTIVMGHRHKWCDVSFEGIRIITCTRGITEIDA